MGTQRKTIKVCFVFNTDLFKKKKSILTVVSKLAGPSYDHAQHSQEKQFPKDADGRLDN